MVTMTDTAAIRTACAAANLAQLAACYREEAEILRGKARKLDYDGDWSVDPDGLAAPIGLPDDWMEIGEQELSTGFLRTKAAASEDAP